MMGALQRRAEEILQLPRADREERYSECRRIHFESALETWNDKVKAEELSAKMDEWLRALVSMIENSGGGSGGRA
jgi:hypothetical protein